MQRIYRRNLTPDWAFPIWMSLALAVTALVAYSTFRYGVWAILQGNGWEPLALFTCLVALASMWRTRPRKKPAPPAKPLGL